VGDNYFDLTIKGINNVDGTKNQTWQAHESIIMPLLLLLCFRNQCILGRFTKITSMV